MPKKIKAPKPNGATPEPHKPTEQHKDSLRHALSSCTIARFVLLNRQSEAALGDQNAFTTADAAMLIHYNESIEKLEALIAELAAKG